MAELLTSRNLLVTLFIFSLVALICGATNYMVGDSSGWDISTDLDTWTNDKTFYVGDVLVFQYSTSNSVEQVNKDSFENCSTTNALETFSNGNTSVALTRAGPWYFIPGNRLYCLGGMKLGVNVLQQANSPSPSPLAAPTGIDGNALPRSSNKNGARPPTSTSSVPPMKRLGLLGLGLILVSALTFLSYG